MLTGRIQIIALALVLSLVAGWTCPLMAADTGVPRCHKSTAPDHDDNPFHTPPCKMLPCRSGGGPVFTIPDPPALRKKKQIHVKFTGLELSGPFNREWFCPAVFQSKAWAFVFLPISAPPQFILNCAFLC
jgi:hypothetical protein